VVRNSKMRWPITPTISDICGEKVIYVNRCAKYLFFGTSSRQDAGDGYGISKFSYFLSSNQLEGLHQ
jgi:hypothetical protein